MICPRSQSCKLEEPRLRPSCICLCSWSPFHFTSLPPSIVWAFNGRHFSHSWLILGQKRERQVLSPPPLQEPDTSLYSQMSPLMSFPPEDSGRGYGKIHHGPNIVLMNDLINLAACTMSTAAPILCVKTGSAFSFFFFHHPWCSDPQLSSLHSTMYPYNQCPIKLFSPLTNPGAG
jgi:hypothetical protein